MDLEQIQSLVRQGESELIEFKKTSGERREAMHTLCAMLNHRNCSITPRSARGPAALVAGVD